MLEFHTERHNPSRLYRCDVCNKPFKHNFTLNVHIRLHIGDNQLYVINALKRFISIRSLKKHNEPVHMGKDDLEKYKCDTCEKAILN